MAERHVKHCRSPPLFRFTYIKSVNQWRYTMKKVNLRELYPDIYKTDTFIEVTDDVEMVFKVSKRLEEAYNRKKYRYKAHYSLDRNDGIEHDALLMQITPEQILEARQLKEQVFTAVMALPKSQAKRIYAHFYLGMSITEIAIAEGVSKSRISESISYGLKNLSKKLK